MSEPPRDTTLWFDASGQIDSALLGNPSITHTYSSTSTSGADGSFTKTGSGQYTDSSGTVNISESATITNGVRELTRTIDDGTGNPVTNTYSDPVSKVSSYSIHKKC